MKNYTRILTILFLALLTFVMSATAQTNDNKNKAIVETTDGTQQLNTDEISIIRFEGDKVTFVQPWGESVFDRTLRSLTFLRPLPGTLRLTVNAGINENSSNRAQEIDGDGKLKTTWESGDVVYVYADESSTTPLGTLTPAPADYGSSSATLVGDITGTGLADGTPTLYFSTQPRATYSLATQDGTVESLFYCTATASVTINGGNATISGTLDFNRPISIVKFTLKDKSTNAAISATSLTVNDGTGTYVVTPASATDVIYVGIPAVSSKTITLNITDGSKYYYYQKTGVSFAENKYYAINVKMEESELARPLTFEAKTGVFTVTLISDLDPLPSLEYSIDGGAWTTYTCNAATPEGHTISFRGDNTAFFKIGAMSAQQSNFSCTADCYLYGNIMSLLSASSYATATSVGEFAFLNLFLNNTKIYSHDTKQLVLPATTLAPNCYGSLFNGCTALTRAPELPATTLDIACYGRMFYGCTALTTAPELRATTLVNGCYSEMFKGCTSLNSITCLATDISADNCTGFWLDGVAATGTFAKALSMTSWTTDSSSGIPSGWTTKNVINLASLTGDYEAQNNDVLTGTLAGNYKITIADGATVTLRNATINGVNSWDYEWAGITCLGNATIILEGTNTVKGFQNSYPGIQAAYNDTGIGDEYTLTIRGTGTLTASSNGRAAGIGGGPYIECGNITISGGTITATGGDDAAGIGSGSGRTCGNITISNGTVTATGGSNAAGIGTGGTGASCGNISISGGIVTATGGSKGAGIGTGKGMACGNITITSDVTIITATKGSGASNSIGMGYQGTCGTVTIGGTEYYDGSAYENEGATYLATSPLVYPTPAPSAPTGAIDGLFSVSSTKQVYFSQGNLQAVCASADSDGSTQETWTWQFASNQYEVGTANSAINGNGSVSTAGTVDLFCWSTDATYYGISTITDNTGLQGAFVDWGGNIGSDWRTLTSAEWDYLFSGRTNAASKYGHGSINGVNGMIILPDSWTLPDGLSFTSGNSASTNSYTTAEWSQMESAGAVFLPAAGIHIGTNVYDVGSTGLYWSSSVYEDNKVYAFRLSFGDDSFLVSSDYGDKSQGCSVRLVIDAE